MIPCCNVGHGIAVGAAVLREAPVPAAADSPIAAAVDPARLVGYVREQLLATVAIICKRGWSDPDSGAREALFSHVEQLLSEGDTVSAMDLSAAYHSCWWHFILTSRI